MRTCKIEGCDGKHVARGWCNKHYRRWLKYGHPSVVRREMDPVHTKEDFLRHVEQDENGCWIWQRYKDTAGYGMLRFNGKTQRTNRAAWQLFRGEIPEGMHVLHNVADGCTSKACVNPDCLRLGTHRENCNDVDRIGEAHHAVNVPNKIVETTIRRYRNGVTQRGLVEWLKLHGCKTTQPTIKDWVNGVTRGDCLERVLNAQG